MDKTRCSPSFRIDENDQKVTIVKHDPKYPFNIVQATEVLDLNKDGITSFQVKITKFKAWNGIIIGLVPL